MGEVQVIIEHLKLLSVDITTTFLINQYKEKKLRRNVKKILMSTGVLKRYFSN